MRIRVLLGRKFGQYFVLHATCTIFVVKCETDTKAFSMETRKKTYLLLVLCIVWAILIFVLCTMPASSLPKIKMLHIDKVAHFVFFFVQSVLVSLLLRFQKKRSYWQIVLFSTFQAFVYGGVIEILQDKFFNRTGELYDLIADTLGGLCGALVYPVIFKLINERFISVFNKGR